MNDPTADDLIALFDELRARRAATNGHAETNGEWVPPTPLVDWVEAYGCGDDPARWLAEPLLPAAGAVAIFAKGGTGKSLLALWLAAGLATGRGPAGPAEPIEVLYLDYEMTLDTVVERLEDMGYAEPEGLAHLHYASLPSLAPLDTAEGGRAVVEMAGRLGVALVVVDTFGRAVNGEEDKADTVRAWYRWTGQLLKTAGIAFLRIDHAGKDVARGQRGTSAKNDDVDIVWEMTAREHGEFLLRATKRRVSWVDERVVLRQTSVDGVLAYHWDGGTTTYLAGTKDVAEMLDKLGAAVDISRREAMILLRDNGHGRANNIVADALRWRREATQYHLQYQQKGASPEGASTTAPNDAKAQQVPPEYQSVPEPELYGGGRHTYVSTCPPPSLDGERPPGLFDDVDEADPW